MDQQHSLASWFTGYSGQNSCVGTEQRCNLRRLRLTSVRKHEDVMRVFMVLLNYHHLNTLSQSLQQIVSGTMRLFSTLLSGRWPPPTASTRPGARSCSRPPTPRRPPHRPPGVGVWRSQSHVFLDIHAFPSGAGLRLCRLCWRFWFCWGADGG